MKRTITILFNNRFNDAERVIGMFSGTGYKVEKINLAKNDEDDLSSMLVVTDTAGKNVENLLVRLRQQIRVVSVECEDGDRFTMEKQLNL